MTNEQSYADEVGPDSLMSDFRGRPVFAILAFTVVVHVVLVGVFSIRYLKNEFLGEDTSAMSEKERLDIAVREATTSLREIAKRHGVSPQELSDRFTKGDSQLPAAAEQPPAETIPQDTPAAPAEPESAIEKELEKKEAGPELPDLPPLEEQDDLFK